MPCSRRRCSMTATTPSTASRPISPSAESGCGDDRPQHRPDAGPRGPAPRGPGFCPRRRRAPGPPEEFAVAGEVAVVDLDAALGKGGGSNADLIREMVRRAPCRVGGGIRDLDTARAWLDAGAAKIMIGTAASPDFCAALPRERVIAAVDAERGHVVVEGWRTATGTPVLERIRDLAPVVGEDRKSVV